MSEPQKQDNNIFLMFTRKKTTSCCFVPLFIISIITLGMLELCSGCEESQQCQKVTATVGEDVTLQCKCPTVVQECDWLMMNRSTTKSWVDTVQYLHKDGSNTDDCSIKISKIRNELHHHIYECVGKVDDDHQKCCDKVCLDVQVKQEDPPDKGDGRGNGNRITTVISQILNILTCSLSLYQWLSG